MIVIECNWNFNGDSVGVPILRRDSDTSMGMLLKETLETVPLDLQPIYFADSLLGESRIGCWIGCWMVATPAGCNSISLSFHQFRPISMNLHQVGFRCFFSFDEFSVLFWLHKLADSWHPWPDGHLRPQQMTETLQHMNLGLASLQGSLVSAAWLTVRWTMALGHQNLRGDFMIFHDSFGFDGYFWWTWWTIDSDNGGLEVQHQVSLDHGRFIRLVGEASGCLLQCHFPALELLWDDRWSKSSQWDTSHDFHFHLSRNLSHLQSFTVIDSRRDDDDDDVRNPPQQWRMEKPLQRCWQTITSRPDGTVSATTEDVLVHL